MGIASTHSHKLDSILNELGVNKNAADAIGNMRHHFVGGKKAPNGSIIRLQIRMNPEGYRHRINTLKEDYVIESADFVYDPEWCTSPVGEPKIASGMEVPGKKAPGMTSAVGSPSPEHQVRPRARSKFHQTQYGVLAAAAARLEPEPNKDIIQRARSLTVAKGDQPAPQDDEKDHEAETLPDHEMGLIDDYMLKVQKAGKWESLRKVFENFKDSIDVVNGRDDRHADKRASEEVGDDGGGTPPKRHKPEIQEMNTKADVDKQAFVAYFKKWEKLPENEGQVVAYAKANNIKGVKFSELKKRWVELTKSVTGRRRLLRLVDAEKRKHA